MFYFFKQTCHVPRWNDLSFCETNRKIVLSLNNGITLQFETRPNPFLSLLSQFLPLRFQNKSYIARRQLTPLDCTVQGVLSLLVRLPPLYTSRLWLPDAKIKA